MSVIDPLRLNLKKLTVMVLGVSVAAATGWRAAISGALHDAPRTQPSPVVKKIVPVPGGTAVSKGSRLSAAGSQQARKAKPDTKQDFEGRLAKMPPTRLLAEYELTGDLRFLEAARRKYGNDPRFLMVAALASKSPHSADLARLEASQPDNALPNILRAGMYAQKNNWKGLKEQLEQAAGKQSLSAGSPERKAALLDLLIASPNRAAYEAVSTKLDENFFSQIESIERGLNRNPSLFGDPAESASVGIGLAVKMRNMGGSDFAAWLASDNIELGLLGQVNNYDPSCLYDTNTTVRQRMDQINAAAADKTKWSAILASVFQPATDASTRVRFFARVRADGEMAALQWLERLNRVDASNR